MNSTSPTTPLPSTAFNSSGQFAWDATSLSLFCSCPRKYKYKLVDGWQPHRKSPHLLFGGWFASALELFEKLVAEGKSRDEAEIDTILSVLIWTWKYGYPTAADAAAKTNPIPGTGRPWKSSHNTKTRENLIRTLVWYFAHYRDDNCETVILASGKPAVEYTFKVDFGDDQLWCGHLDKLVQYGDEYYVMDQKSTGGTVGTYWFDQWATDGQMTGYTFAGNIIYNLPVKGVIIDAAQIAVGFSRFERGFTNRTQDQLDEWVADTKYWIAMAQQCYQQNWWPMNRSSCGNYGGCEFRSVCGRSADTRKQFLKADFTQERKWNPLEER